MAKARTTMELWDWIGSLDNDELVKVLRRAAKRSPAVAEALERERATTVVDLTSLRQQIVGILTPYDDGCGYLGYRETQAFAQGGDEAVRLLKRVLKNPTPGALGLVEAAIRQVATVLPRCDDSSGSLGALVWDLVEVHQEALRHARLDADGQARLARWVLEFARGDVPQHTDLGHQGYYNLFDDTGRAAFAALVRDAAAACPGDSTLESLLTDLAVMSGDRDQVLAAHGGEPGSQGEAVMLVRALDAAGLPDDALHFAEKGLALPTATWHRSLLVERVASGWATAGRSDDVATLRRTEFDAAPTVKTLAAWRDAVGPETWTNLREGAEARLRASAPRELLHLLLTENRDAEAWELGIELQTAWDGTEGRTLLKRRAATHPADVVPIYRRLADATLAPAKPEAYYAGANLLLDLRDAMNRTGQADEFRTYLQGLHEQYRRRRLCLEIFRESGLSL